MATVLDYDPLILPRLHRMSYETYERLVNVGYLSPDDRVELLDGLLVEKMTKSSDHSTAVGMGQDALQPAVPAGWHVRSEQPIALIGGPRGDSAPEPDLAIVIGARPRYKGRHPIPSEVGLVVEVASSREALAIDRVGLARYAHAGIPVACIVDVAGERIEVYRSPLNGSYREREVLSPGQDLTGEIGTEATGPAAITPVPVSSFFAET